nr:MAG TPA: hypothetical protein [Caudoviricetes sp.]
MQKHPYVGSLIQRKPIEDKNNKEYPRTVTMNLQAHFLISFLGGVYGIILLIISSSLSITCQNSTSQQNRKTSRTRSTSTWQRPASPTKSA